MDELIQKYLDGELSEEEAAALTRALSGDPTLEAELRALEQSLALAAANARREPSAGFTEEVMERVAAPVASTASAASAAGASQASAGAPARSSQAAREAGSFWARFGARAGRPSLAWVAALVVVFALGYLSAQQGGGPVGPESANKIPSSAASGEQARVKTAPTNAPAPLRLVRLIYVPQAQDVQRVTVAGTFNGWDPEGTALHKEGGAWVVQLVLPPQTYEYMFVENGEQWVTDPLAFETRDDGFGKKNAVLDLTL